MRPDTRSHNSNESQEFEPLFSREMEGDDQIKETEVRHYRDIMGAGEKAKVIASSEKKMLETLKETSLPVELQMEILQDPETASTLAYYGQGPSDQEALAIIQRIARKHADLEAKKLEQHGLKFFNDGTPADDPENSDLLQYENVRRGLEKLNRFLDILPQEPLQPDQVAPVPKTTKSFNGSLEATPAPVADYDADKVYAELVNAGIDTTVVQNALSSELLTELEHENYSAGKTNILTEAINKTIRAMENKGGFTLNSFDEPKPLGILNRVKNFISGGSVSTKQKSSREYRNIISLQSLKDAIAINVPNEPAIMRYPDEATFAPNPKTNDRRAAVARPLRWATGLATAAAVGTSAIPTSEATHNPEPTRETVARTPDVAPTVTVAAQAESAPVYSPRFEEVQEKRQARRQTEDRFTQTFEASAPEVETAAPRQTIESVAPERAPVRKTTKETASAKRKTVTKFKINAFNGETTPINKKAERASKKAKEIVESMIPSDAIDRVLNKKSVSPMERAQAAKAKAKEIAAQVKAKREAAPESKAKTKAQEVAESMIPSDAIDRVLNKKSVSPMERAPQETQAKAVEAGNSLDHVEQAFLTKFGSAENASRYLMALPAEVRNELRTLSPDKARAMLSDRIINLHNDPKITADRITALHTAKTILEKF